MTVLAWDEVGTRTYESGLDRGVLYVPDGLAVPWNGLISVSEKVDGGTLSSHYMDGQKYADLLTGENFRATIEAYTYPEEFEQFNGMIAALPGMLGAQQPRGRFGLAYRTRVGNDVNADLGYKIHLIYNATALPSTPTYNSLSNDIEPTTFSWDIVTVPTQVPGIKPTAHIIIDPKDYTSDALEAVETALYGDSGDDAYLPTPTELMTILSDYMLIITDNLDGTWTATGPASFFNINTSDEFELEAEAVTYLDANTYEISSSDN